MKNKIQQIDYFVVGLESIFYFTFTSLFDSILFLIVTFQLPKSRLPLGSLWQIGISSGWESEGPGFEPRWLQATFDPGLPKKITNDSQPKTVCL